MSTIINERIASLRAYMKKVGLQAFIVPSTDAHMSEYIPLHWESRAWISGFTGSSGTIVVTQDKAGLWTDSRYFLQAIGELEGSQITLYKDRIPGTPSIVDWLLSELSEEDNVGIDGKVYSAKEALLLSAKLAKQSLTLIPYHDPFNSIWSDRPALPKNKITVLPDEYTGEPANSKINRILSKVHQAGAESIFVSTLDTIAWIFNIRGSDVPYNPVTVAHAFLSKDQSILFIDKDKVPQMVIDHLTKEKVSIVAYNQVKEFISQINISVCIDSAKISFDIYNTIPSKSQIVDILSPADLLKSMKNEVEAEGFRKAMIRDGVALIRFYMWLEEAVPKGLVTEYNIGLKLKEFRTKQALCEGESFNTIAGYGANAAKNHYHPTENTCLNVIAEGFLLIDSGAQYLDGTTDITRTVSFGEVSEDMKRDYTLVLKGQIGLATAIFPKGTRGSQIDILARAAMWKQGINYLHGTGHGVGHYLNVHEGPHSIRPEENPVTMEIGMIASNEPGIYRDYKYGVRTENLMLTQLEQTSEYGDFYSFETLTLFPIDTKPIIRSMLTDFEVDWLNDYHRKVYKKLSPFLYDNEKNWLQSKTQNF